MIELIDYDRLDENNVRGLFGCDSAEEVNSLPTTQDLTAYGLPHVHAAYWSLCIVGPDKRFYYRTETGWERIGN